MQMMMQDSSATGLWSTYRVPTAGYGSRLGLLWSPPSLSVNVIKALLLRIYSAFQVVRRRLWCSVPLWLYAFAIHIGINWTASFGHERQFAIRTACVTTDYHWKRSNCSLKHDLRTTPNDVRHRCSLSCDCDAVTAVHKCITLFKLLIHWHVLHT